MSLPVILANALLPKAAAYLAEQGSEIIDKIVHDPEEFKKHCAVCGKRIKGDLQFVVSERFVCRVCGHRTHKHCANDRHNKICRKCADEERASQK